MTFLNTQSLYKQVCQPPWITNRVSPFSLHSRTSACTNVEILLSKVLTPRSLLPSTPSPSGDQVIPFDTHSNLPSLYLYILLSQPSTSAPIYWLSGLQMRWRSFYPSTQPPRSTFPQNSLNLTTTHSAP